MDQVINSVGRVSCNFFYEIGGNSLADFIQCSAGYDYVASGWYIMIGAFLVFSGGGFIFFQGSPE